MEDLPFDIQLKIVSHVPHESVLDCKLVSKTWKTLFSHKKNASGLLLSRIIQDEFHRTTYAELRFGYSDEILSHTPWDKNHRDRCLFKNLTKMKHPLANIGIYGRCIFTGSCNGLICSSIHDDTVSNICVFNPFTEECFNLPTIIDCQNRQIGIGFGYNASGGNYKVVAILYNRINMKISVQVYTLGGDSSGWRNIGEIDCLLEYNGILWNGSLHWFDTMMWKKKIVAFNLADEAFRYLPVPPSFIYTADAKLTLLGGYLSIVSKDRDIQRTKIWSFKNKRNDDFAVEEEGYYPSWDWSLEFSIPFFRIPSIVEGDDIDEGGRYYEPFGVTENNEVFLWYRKLIMCGASTRTILCRYDPKTNTLNKTLHCGVTVFNGISHVNSLVSLKGLGVDSKTIDQFLADCAECGSHSRM